MFEYFFLYNIANRRNRTSDIEETNSDKDSEGEDSEADLESVSDMEVNI